MTIQYEQALVGSAIAMEGEGVEALELNANEFSEQSYANVWKDVLKGVTDAVELGKKHGDEIIMDAIRAAIPSQMNSHAKNIKKAAEVRHLSMEFSKAIKKVEAGSSVDEALMGISIESSGKTSYKSIGEASMDVYEDMSGRDGKPDGDRFIKTGFVDFDKDTGGLERGSLVIIAARPSMGKTSWLMNVCLNIAETKNVLFNSIEMDLMSIAYRAISSDSNLNLKSLRTEKEFPVEVWQKASGSAMKMNELNLFIDDNPDMSASKICARASAFARGKQVDVLAVDYIGLLNPEDGSKKRHEDIGAMTRMFKKIAKKLNCCVILLSQLNREAEGVRPSLAHLRESGSIEQDADMIVFPYRYEKGKELIEPALLIVGKNRQGPIGDIEVVFESKTASYRNKEWRHG